MNSKMDTEIDVNTSNESYRAECTDPVQPPSTARYLSTCLKRLGNWMTARIKAHEDRVSSLRVYSQHRLDGALTTSATTREHASQ